MLLATGSLLSQIMLLGGMVLLAWILIRRNIRIRARSRSVDRQIRSQKAASSTPVAGAPLADAPKEVLRWQASMFDLQRDLKAELDTRVAVVQSLLRQVDQRVAELKTLQTSSPNPPSAATISTGHFGKIRKLHSIGFSLQEISERLEIPLADVELSLGIQSDLPQPSNSL